MIGFRHYEKRIYSFNLSVIPTHQHKEDFFGTYEIVMRNMIGDGLREHLLIGAVQAIGGMTIVELCFTDVIIFEDFVVEDNLMASFDSFVDPGLFQILPLLFGLSSFYAILSPVQMLYCVLTPHE